MIRWQHQDKPELKAEGASLCTMELEPGAVALQEAYPAEAAR